MLVESIQTGTLTGVLFDRDYLDNLLCCRVSEMDFLKWTMLSAVYSTTHLVIFTGRVYLRNT
jgi:hypothetical protein